MSFGIIIWDQVLTFNIVEIQSQDIETLKIKT